MKKTALADWHESHGARMVDFAGWAMPVQYTSIIKEHEHTRTRAGLFDISHMGEFLVRGPQATRALSRVLTHNLATLKPGRCRYGFMLNPAGGIIDDLLVYRLEESSYMLVVNAAREQVDFDHLQDGLSGDVHLENVSSATSKIDLQGPASVEILEAALPGSWRRLPFFAFALDQFEDAPLLVSRTGYTGELGFELYVGNAQATALWELLVSQEGVLPVGLGARDTLRLEAGLPLYGQDLDEEHTPVEAGYGRMLTSEADYMGKDALGTVREKLVGMTIPGRRSARRNDPVHLAGGMEDPAVGRITSGSFAPSLGHCVALAWVAPEAAEAGGYEIKGARTTLSAQAAEPPFYQGTARKKLS